MTTGLPLDKAEKSGSAVEAAWPDLFANLQAAYAKVIDTQFEMERRAAELEDSRDLLRQVIASMSEALFLLDRTGRIMQVNPAALALTEYSENDCLGQLFRKICPDPNAPTSAWKILNKSTQGAITGLETELRGRDGRAHRVNLSATVVRNRNGRIDGVLIIVQNLQPQQQLQSEQAQIHRQTTIAQFAGRIVHELAAPLDIIRGYSQHLQQIVRLNNPPNEQWLDDLERIELAADEVAKFAINLERMNQPALGTFKPLDLNQLVEAALLLAPISVNSDAIIITRLFKTPLPAIQGDWHELVYAVSELIQTLYDQFTLQLTTIQLETGVEDKLVRLDIRGESATELVEQTFPIPPVAAGAISRHSGKIQMNLNGRKVSLSLQFPGLLTEK